MILSDQSILNQIEAGKILIVPFNRSSLGTNSYDVHLSPYFATYRDSELDAQKHNEAEHFKIPEKGYVLRPNEIYLGSTMEYTETHDFVPFLEGKSSVGRLGIDIHATAGKGDSGFCNYWTLEISVKKPVRIYAGMPIGQLIYFEIQGEVLRPYNEKEGAKYTSISPKPIESMLWKSTFPTYPKNV